MTVDTMLTHHPYPNYSQPQHIFNNYTPQGHQTNSRFGIHELLGLGQSVSPQQEYLNQQQHYHQQHTQPPSSGKRQILAAVFLSHYTGTWASLSVNFPMSEAFFQNLISMRLDLELPKSKVSFWALGAENYMRNIPIYSA